MKNNSNKNFNLEIKIYELLGIKYFKKFVLKLRDIVYSLFFFIPKEELEIIKNRPDNYKMGITDKKEKILKYKKSLYFNGSVHIFGMFYSMLCIIFTENLIFHLICFIINMYCVMLQRYNYIRINNLLKKVELKEKSIKSMPKEVNNINNKQIEVNNKIIKKTLSNNYISNNDTNIKVKKRVKK